jgi:hypothetical protein
MKVSTGLRNHMLGTGSLKSALALGFIRIYSGTPPVSADSAIGGSNQLLCTISVGSTGTGLTLDTPVSGAITKNTSEVWSGVASGTGTATFFRHTSPTDTDVDSATELRIQGSVGLIGADLNLSSVSLTNGATQTIDYYTVGLPSL